MFAPSCCCVTPLQPAHHPVPPVLLHLLPLSRPAHRAMIAVLVVLGMAACPTAAQCDTGTACPDGCCPFGSAETPCHECCVKEWCDFANAVSTSAAFL